MKTVLVTGCSSGIGKETALLFQSRGWNAAAIVRDPGADSGLAGLQQLRCYGVDVTDQQAIREGVANVISDFGRIDVLVNNAGVYTTKPLECTTDEEVARIVETNLMGAIRMTQAVLPQFRKQKGGTIVNVSSVAGRTTFPYQTVYHATKWALEGLSESLTFELRDLKVAVKLVEPGMVKTALYDSTVGMPKDEYPEDYRRSFRNWHDFLMKNLRSGYSPRRDAETIFRAATDGRSKLRYTTDFTTRLLLAMRGALPLSVLTGLVRRLCGA